MTWCDNATQVHWSHHSTISEHWASVNWMWGHPNIQTHTYMSSSGGMMISGRSIARHCIAAAESLLPILLNIARDATVVIPVTNWVISESLSCEASGTAGTHVFRYLSLQLTQISLTLKSGSEVKQGHPNFYHSIAYLRFPTSML